MKGRVTLTIEQDLLNRIDATVDNEKVKNRSHAVELLLRQSLRGAVPSTAVVLAGGGYDANLPETKNIPKAMVSVQDKPILQHNIELLKKFGVEQVILAVQYKASAIKKYFGDGKDFGVAITYVEEDEPLGTAGCLRILKDELTRPFLMLNGDELKDIDLEKFFAAHNKYQGAITIALTTTTDPGEYGVAMLDGNNILRFDEKPQDGAQSMLINAGLYIMEPTTINTIPEGFSMLEQDVFPALARDGKLFGYPFSGQWFAIENKEDIVRAEQRWRR